MKRILAVLLACLMLFGCLACKAKPTTEPNNSEGTQPQQSEGADVDVPDEPADAVTPQKGGKLSIAYLGDAVTFVPYLIRNPADGVFMQGCYETLLQFSANGEVEPYLAKSYTADVENLKYTFVLNEGVKFHDGSELTAEVAKYCLDNYKEKGIQSAAFFAFIDRIEVVDEYTFDIYMTEWDSTLPHALARGCGYIYSMEAFEAVGEEGFNEKPIGSGPFMVESREFDVKLTLVRFDDYWQGTPYLDAVEYVVYGNEVVAQAALENDEVQVMFPSTPDTADYLAAQGFNLAVSAIPYAMYCINFNCTNENDPFYDIRVRQAFCYAMDAETIRQALVGDHGVVTNQLEVPGGLCYNEDIKGYPHDIEKAKALLKEAGYEDGFKTKILVYNAQVYLDLMTAVKDQVAAVGIEVELEPIDIATLLTSIDGWSEGILFHTVIMSNGTPSQLNSNFRQNLVAGLGRTSFLHPDDVNEAIVNGCRTSGEESLAYFKEAMRLIYDEYCILNTFITTKSDTITSPRLHDAAMGEINSSSAKLWLAWLEPAA